VTDPGGSPEEIADRIVAARRAGRLRVDQSA
jgi:hypothetical protein